MSAFPQFNRLKQCRHGVMLYNVNDIYLGRSLDQYGEYSEGEIDLFRQLVAPGHVVVEVGANIGAHTVWFAQAVGPAGAVIALEPQRVVFQTLCANVALNSLTNVRCIPAAVGKAPGQIIVPQIDYTKQNNFAGLELGSYQQGETTPVIAIDDWGLSAIHFLKIDVEGMEQDVLEGARQTIAAHAPLLYVENDRLDKANDLLRCIDSLGYTMYWHGTRLFNPNNWLGNSLNFFGDTTSGNMLCVPKNSPLQVTGLQPMTAPA